jgi:Protein of unknown function (DUF4238)
MVIENRRQHYVPRFYLERFVDHLGYLWVYEVGSSCRRSLPREVGHQRDYYALETDGERSDLVDRCLQQSETAAGKLLPKIARAEEIDEHEWSELCTFLGLLFARVPATRNYADRTYGKAATSKFLAVIEDAVEFSRLFERSKHRIIDATTAEEFRQRLLEGYRLEQDSQYHNLITMMDVAQEATDCLSRFSWEITTTEEEQFVTADNPVVTVTPDGHGMAAYGQWFDAPGVLVLFPLSSAVCLVLRKRSAGRRHPMSSKQVRCINSAVMALADRFMFAHEKSERLRKVFDKKGCKTEYTETKFLKIRPEWLV